MSDAISRMLDDEIRRRAESMKLFERDGLIYYGAWRRWWSAGTKDERDSMLVEFRSNRGAR